MFDKFRGALLLAVGAVAVDDNCCTLYEDIRWEGTSVNLCYESQDWPSYFNIRDYGIESVGSIECGQSISYHICKALCYSYQCRGSISSNRYAEIDAGKNWVKLEYIYYPRPH